MHFHPCLPKSFDFASDLIPVNQEIREDIICAHFLVYKCFLEFLANCLYCFMFLADL